MWMRRSSRRTLAGTSRRSRAEPVGSAQSRTSRNRSEARKLKNHGSHGRHGETISANSVASVASVVPLLLPKRKRCRRGDSRSLSGVGTALSARGGLPAGRAAYFLDDRDLISLENAIDDVHSFDDFREHRV